MKLIDADREIRELEKMVVEGETFITAVEFAKLILRNAQTVDSESVRHGKWINSRDCLATCSCCRDRWGSIRVMKYCPSCGAKMDGEEE